MHASSSAYLVFLLLLLLPSCDSRKQVEGEIFIKTQGSDNVPLSLLEVSVYSSRSAVATIDRAFRDCEKTGIRDFHGQYVWERRPTPDSTVRTDSQGHFHATIPSHKVYVAAHAHRNLATTTEEYYWLVPFSAGASGDNDKIILANNNLLEYP